MVFRITRDGEDGSHVDKFAIGDAKLVGGLTGTEGNGTLQQGTTGSASWLIIPRSDAAPCIDRYLVCAGRRMGRLCTLLFLLYFYFVVMQFSVNACVRLNQVGGELQYSLDGVGYSVDLVPDSILVAPDPQLVRFLYV